MCCYVRGTAATACVAQRQQLALNGLATEKKHDVKNCHKKMQYFFDLVWADPPPTLFQSFALQTKLQ